MGRAVRGAAVARARAVRGTDHGSVAFTPWERASPLPLDGRELGWRRDRCCCPSVTAITAGPFLTAFDRHAWLVLQGCLESRY
jgi:hypothetical protein